VIKSDETLTADASSVAIAFLTASGALKPAEEATTEGQEDSTAPVTDPVTDTQGE
jgi:hypothetical protein